MEEHLAPSTQLSVLEQSQPIELLIVIDGNEAKLAELEQQVASLQRKAAESFRCQDAKLLRTQLAEARAETDAHSKRLELQQEQLDQAHAAVSLQGRLGLATDCMVPMLADAARSSGQSVGSLRHDLALTEASREPTRRMLNRPCLPHRQSEVAASLRLRSTTATLLAGRIVQLESALSVASRRLKLVCRLLLLASALLGGLLAMFWWAPFAKTVCDEQLVSTCDAEHPVVDPIVAIDPTEWNGTNCTAVYGTFELDDVQALLDARLALAERLEEEALGS